MKNRGQLVVVIHMHEGAANPAFAGAFQHLRILLLLGLFFGVLPTTTKGTVGLQAGVHLLNFAQTVVIVGLYFSLDLWACASCCSKA